LYGIQSTAKYVRNKKKLIKYVIEKKNII